MLSHICRAESAHQRNLPLDDGVAVPAAGPGERSVRDGELQAEHRVRAPNSLPLRNVRVVLKNH